jgi:hypothetical protein
MMLDEPVQRWAVIARNDRVYESTIRETRKESMDAFTKGSEHPWKYWRIKYGYRCVKVKFKVQEVRNDF